VTPTLVGRWQTRVVLLATVGLLITLPFAAVTGTPPFVVLAYVATIGLAWDILYSFLQAFRWERDWPPAFAVIAAIAEAALIYVLATMVDVPGLPRDLPLGLFAAHYAAVWLGVFLFAQFPMRALFPWWRFHGGRIWPGVARSQRHRTRGTE
jgi:hypothetical protein